MADQPMPDVIPEPMEQDPPVAEAVPAEPNPEAPSATGGVHPAAQPVLASGEVASAPEASNLVPEGQNAAAHVELTPEAAAPPLADVELLEVPDVKLDAFCEAEYEKLKDTELTNGTLKVQEYIVLYLIDLLRCKREAVFTLYRAKQQYPKNELIVNLWSIGQFLTTRDATDTIQRTRGLLNKYASFRPYLEEYINRLTVYTIFAVAKSYTTIFVKQLQHLLVHPDNFTEILEQLQWPINGGYVQVSENNAVLNYATKHINTKDFGSFNCLPKLNVEGRKNESTTIAADSVQKLMQVADALSKVKMPPPKAAEGKENGDKSESTPPDSV